MWTAGIGQGVLVNRARAGHHRHGRRELMISDHVVHGHDAKGKSGEQQPLENQLPCPYAHDSDSNASPFGAHLLTYGVG